MAFSSSFFIFFFFVDFLLAFFCFVIILIFVDFSLFFVDIVVDFAFFILCLFFLTLFLLVFCLFFFFLSSDWWQAVFVHLRLHAAHSRSWRHHTNGWCVEWFQVSLVFFCLFFVCLFFSLFFRVTFPLILVFPSFRVHMFVHVSMFLCICCKCAVHTLNTIFVFKYVYFGYYIFFLFFNLPTETELNKPAFLIYIWMRWAMRFQAHGIALCRYWAAIVWMNTPRG